jgi:RHS repeat-associated protein
MLTTYWVSVDHLNRPIKMTNAAKASVWDAVWQPFGGAHSITGSATLNARLPGQWFQSETGLHYNWHRSYDPTLGRYTQPDPLGFVDGPSVYGYGRGSPLRYVDRDGLMSGPQSLPQLPTNVEQCAPAKQFRDCSPAELVKCVTQCGARGVESCKVGQRSKVKSVTRSITGLLLKLYELSDFPVSCSCNDG